MGLHKILKIVGLLLSIAGMVFLAMILFKGEDVVKSTGEGVDGYLYVAYILLAMIVIIVLLFVLKGVFSGNLKKTLVSIGGFVLILIISYVLADGVETPLREGGMLSAGGSRLVGMGLYAFYIMAILAIGAMVLSGVNKIRK